MALNAVHDAAAAQRIPERYGVDRNHRLVEPALSLDGNSARWQRCTDRQQSLDIPPIELAQCVADILLRHLRDHARGLALEPLEPDHVEASFQKIAFHHFVASRLMRGQNRNLAGAKRL